MTTISALSGQIEQLRLDCQTVPQSIAQAQDAHTRIKGVYDRLKGDLRGFLQASHPEAKAQDEKLDRIFRIFTISALSSQIEQLRQECQTVPQSIAEAQNLHKRIKGVYDRLKGDLRGFLQASQPSLEGSVGPEFLEATAKYEELDRIFRVFSDKIVTQFPHAAIDYGTTMVGPRRAWTAEDVNKRETMRELSGRYPEIRKIRGDGNCFLTSFTVGYLESLVASKKVDQLIHLIFNDGLDKEYQDELINTLCVIQTTPLQLESYLSNNQKILPFVHYFRRLAADYMLKNAARFAPFLEGETIQSYVDQKVLPMGEEMDNPSINALCSALKTPLLICDPGIDRTSKITETKILDGEPLMTVCRDGAHYFFLYKNKTISTSSAASAAAMPLPAEPAITEISIEGVDLPFGSTLFIRGSFNNWQSGAAMTDSGQGRWKWNARRSLDRSMEYKFIINDDPSMYETGANRKLSNSDPMRRPEFAKKPATVELDAHAAANVTRLTVKYQSSVPLFVKGDGPGMNQWSRAIPLIKLDEETWVIEWDRPFDKPFEYKILAGDRWETGSNRTAKCGVKEEICPNL